VPVLAAAAGAIAALAIGLRGPAAVLTYALAFFLSATVAQEVARGVRARRALHRETTGTALANLFRRSGRRYGGYVVHVGIALIAVAIATSQAATVEGEATLAPGGSMEVAGRRIVLERLREVDEPRRRQVVADLSVADAGSGMALTSALTYYPNATAAIGSPGIGSTPGGDVYAILAAYDARAYTWATIQVRVIPLVSWLWIGGAVVGIGALVAALPPPRRREDARPVPVAAGSEASAK
jgi:cytochrome c-type biogenesis protein CcmF